jgi:dienelactone hydrolase
MQYLLSLALLLCTVLSSFAGTSIDYTVNGESYEGYLVKGQKKAPMILIVHDWDGLTGYEMKRADMLGALGYDVFAADLYGKGVRPASVDDKKKLTGALYQNRTKMRQLMNGALDKAKAEGLNTNNGVAIGYCFGGAAILELARSGAPLKGFVAFHGGLATPEGQDYNKAHGKYLILHGGADQVVPMTDFATIAGQLEKVRLDYEMIVYSGAPHAFTVFDSQTYQKEADNKSWQRFIDFLKNTL